MANTTEEVQALLRFLTQDAKVPLAVALPTYPKLRSNGLATPQAIVKADKKVLSEIITDDKLLKQVVNAAKRATKTPVKRHLTDSVVEVSPKKPKFNEHDTEQERETQLELPTSKLSLDELRVETIETNRAPLFLASHFVHLSIAQAVTSAGAQSKARYLGIEQGRSAEQEGWAQGQPKVKLMGREVSVMRRHVPVSAGIKVEDIGGQSTSQTDDEGGAVDMREAYWGLDLEALRKSNSSLVAGKMHGSIGPPVHRPENARAYLLKSIDFVDDNTGSQKLEVKEEEDDIKLSAKKPISAADRAARREQAVAALLKCIDHVCDSWADTLLPEDIDKKAAGWYMKVRPDVRDGQSGWGQRGRVALRDILELSQEDG